jgi:two-component system sensor histidine kinase TctE
MLARCPTELRGVVENTNSLLARIDTAISTREQFIGNIAHQIRTPLAGIKLQAQLAEDELEEKNPALLATLKRISEAADAMTHVNSQLMKLARAEAGYGPGTQAGAGRSRGGKSSELCSFRCARKPETD